MAPENRQRRVGALPLEVVLEVFAHLSAMDKVAASSVSRVWMQAAMEETIDGVRVELPGLPSAWAADGRKTYIGRFSSFVFSGIDLTVEFLDFLQQYGHNIRALRFVGCRIAPGVADLCREKSLCGKLQELEFVDCFFDIFPALPELRDLAFLLRTDDARLSDADLAGLCGTVGTKLDSLRLYLLCQDLREPEDVLPCELAVTTEGVVDLIEKKSESLTNVSVYVKGECSTNSVSDVFEMDVFQRFGKQLWFDAGYTFFDVDSLGVRRKPLHLSDNQLQPLKWNS